MPYKDPERKRQWEREHREQRNARRRIQRLKTRSGHQNIEKPASDQVSQQSQPSGWKVALGFAVGVGIGLLAIFGDMSGIRTGSHINLSPPSSE